MIGKAFEFALRHHQGQVDKSGAAYIGHVARVCEAVRTDGGRVVALLHDTVEDSGASLDEVRTEFGGEIADAVDAITHRPGETQTDYLARVKRNSLALEVKRADIADNSAPVRLTALDTATADRLRCKYAKALEILDGQ